MCQNSRDLFLSQAGVYCLLVLEASHNRPNLQRERERERERATESLVTRGFVQKMSFCAPVALVRTRKHRDMEDTTYLLQSHCFALYPTKLPGGAITLLPSSSEDRVLASSCRAGRDRTHD